METQKIYNQRLLTFADHLAKIDLHPEHGILITAFMVHIVDKARITYEIRYPYCVMQELVVCFPDDWKWHERTTDPVLENSDPREGTVHSLVDYFGMTMEELAHCYDCDGFQDIERFGGEILTTDSGCIEVAKNIRELVKRRLK
jgi:hypothetical protein